MFFINIYMFLFWRKETYLWRQIQRELILASRHPQLRNQQHKSLTPRCSFRDGGYAPLYPGWIAVWAELILSVKCKHIYVLIWCFDIYVLSCVFLVFSLCILINSEPCLKPSFDLLYFATDSLVFLNQYRWLNLFCLVF